MSFVKTLLSAFGLSIALSLFAAPVTMAQTTSVGVIDYGKIRADSRAGQSITSQLATIRTELNTELAPAEQALRSASETFAAKFEGLSPEEQNAKVEGDEELQKEFIGLAQGEQAVEAGAQVATLIYQATREKAWNDFGSTVAPLVEQVAGENGIEIVLSRGQVVYFDSGTDLSAKVVAKLDATTTSIPVVRQQLVVDQSGQVVGAQAPQASE